MGCGGSSAAVSPESDAAPEDVDALAGFLGASGAGGDDMDIPQAQEPKSVRDLAAAFMSRPPSWREERRWQVWPLLASTGQVKALHAAVGVSYEGLLAVPPKEEDRVCIQKDVPRTHGRILIGGEVLSALERVLLAYAAYDPPIGFTQGMSFWVGALLAVGISEETTFWLFVSLMSRFGIGGLYRRGFSLARKVNDGMMSLIKRRLPKLFKHFEENDVPPHLFVLTWFLSGFFSSQLPFRSVLCIIDAILCDGPPRADRLFSKKQAKEIKRSDSTRPAMAPAQRGFTALERSCEDLPPAMFRSALAMLMQLEGKILAEEGMDAVYTVVKGGDIEAEHREAVRRYVSNHDSAVAGVGIEAASRGATVPASNTIGDDSTLAPRTAADPTESAAADADERREYVPRDRNQGPVTVPTTRWNGGNPLPLPLPSIEILSTQADDEIDGSMYIYDWKAAYAWMLPDQFGALLSQKALQVSRKQLAKFTKEAQ